MRQAVVLDTGSDDATLAILQRAALEWPWLHVAQGPFESFAAARNLSLDVCLARLDAACTHVLLLDADEYLDAANLHALAAAAARLGGEANLLANHGDTAARSVDVNTDTEADDALFCVSDVLLGGDAGAANDARDAPSGASAAAPEPAPIDTTQWPCCLAMRIVCVDALGERVHRTNSGLLNPRVFPASHHVRFANAVGKRFERLMLATGTGGGEQQLQPLPSVCLQRRARVEFFHAIAGATATRRRKNEQYRELDRSGGGTQDNDAE